MFLAIPLHGKAGLWIEMKKPGGRLTVSQKAWIKLMELLNYAVIVPFTVEEAKQGIIDYIAGFENAPERVLKAFTYDRCRV